MGHKRVGVIGWPIEHSLSPVMHNAAFAALGMADEWSYDAMAIPPDIARHGVSQPKQHGYIGINVTVPFKEVVLQYTRPDDKARAIGAANTIDFRSDEATNTDVDGFIGDLQAHDVTLKGARALVLGAGGAARAAVYGLWQQGAEIVVVNQESLSPEQEMVEDLLAIVQTFSGRLSGMRKYKPSIKEDFAAMPIRQPKDACE